MRQAKVYFKGDEAGILTQFDDGSYTFRYHDLWMKDQNKPPISLTLPKTKQEYHSQFLFPFFFHMLPEGENKETVCHLLKIDQDDYFGILTYTARYDAIGAVTLQKSA